MSGPESDPFNAAETHEMGALAHVDVEKPKGKHEEKDKRQWGTMAPAEKHDDYIRKASFDIGIYKAYGGCVLADDSEEEDDNLGDYVQAIEYKGQTGHSEVARNTVAGVNSFGKTYFFLVKAFLGSGMLTLPMGFTNGGVGFCVGCMMLICFISIMGMETLLDARQKVGGSFSDLAERALGSTGRVVIDISLALCQVSATSEGRSGTARCTSSSLRRT